MNQKELNEIRRRLTLDKNTITNEKLLIFFLQRYFRGQTFSMQNYHKEM